MSLLAPSLYMPLNLTKTWCRDFECPHFALSLSRPQEILADGRLCSTYSLWWFPTVGDFEWPLKPSTLSCYRSASPTHSWSDLEQGSRAGSIRHPSILSVSLWKPSTEETQVSHRLLPTRFGEVLPSHCLLGDFPQQYLLPNKCRMEQGIRN